MTNSENNNTPVYVIPLLVFTVVVVCGLYYDAFVDLLSRWDKQEEYSHGYLIPILTAYFIWLRRFDLQREVFKASWWGAALAGFALILYFIGTISILFIVLDYSFILLLVGLCWAVMGWKALKIILLPLLMLAFSIPLPYFLEALLSAELQLLSSKLGVDFIRLCNIPVFLEGNVIDLGVYKLQVVEACSGLRYLFPLMSLGFICAYMFDAVFWKRAVVFLSSIPITIIMNAFRIGVVGVLVDNWGIEMAEGFMHDFEGWAVFMVCLSVLILEIYLLTKFSRDSRPFAEVFGLVVEEPETSPPELTRTLGLPFYVSLGLLLACFLIILLLGKGEEIIPERSSFTEFPLKLNGWQGRRQSLGDDELQLLQVTDYLLTDYSQPYEEPVNLYIAYYQSQKRSVVPHSPRVCIPGGGWEISAISRYLIDEYPINRMIIKKGESKQLVYYWYQLHGNVIANEFKMKWVLLNGSLFLNRSDGALVRLVTDIAQNESVSDADNRLQQFFKNVMPLLDNYIPE